MCFIYRFEGNPEFVVATERLFDAIERGELEAVCSVLVVTELLTLPLRAGRPDLADSYRAILTRFPNLELAPLDVETALQAASLRAAHHLRTPDALHLATAVRADVDAFVTADARLRSIDRVPIALLPRASTRA